MYLFSRNNCIRLDDMFNSGSIYPGLLLLSLHLRWRQALKAREHVRQCASDIPPLPPLMSLPWQLEVLCPLEKRRRVEVTTSVETAGQLEESRKERERRRSPEHSVIFIPYIVHMYCIVTISCVSSFISDLCCILFPAQARVLRSPRLADSPQGCPPRLPHTLTPSQPSHLLETHLRLPSTAHPLSDRCHRPPVAVQKTEVQYQFISSGCCSVSEC